MKNENYYKNELELLMGKFIEKQTIGDDNDFKWVGDNLPKLMADAAFSVLAASVDVQEYLIKAGELKN